ncbi:filamentous hemagglutinin N-terminal domain-containing protein, partial [Rodentibacter heidelbergensis]|uniref:two-partner secretion domain-containing protein n=1 Tax=Rodentibacter heidelbergensis TaxID=1908258 RepID=UPI00117BC104
MNKNHYKVIFSRVLNQLIVVSELAKTQGKATCENLESTETKTTLNSTALLSSPVACLLNPIHFSLMVALGFVYLAPNSAQAHVDMAIRADKSAPGNQQPTILQTANGLPQVNIQTPSAAGVSRNQYSQFDVAEKGAVLNNARKATQSQMAGWVQGNPNLARGEAKVILNEVNSVNPSRLKGYVEVAGKKADVVIANPSGIHCEGCGVINAGRATMTTGYARLENGELKGYEVKGGQVTVSGKGMDNTQSDYTDIIAEKVKIDGGVWSKKAIKVTTGKNRVNRTNDSVVYVGDKNRAENDRTSEPQTNQQHDQSYAVDVSQLGGMYAERIHLVDNGSGLGVRHAGHIGASAGNVQIDSEGRIVNSGTISAT